MTERLKQMKQLEREVHAVQEKMLAHLRRLYPVGSVVRVEARHNVVIDAEVLDHYTRSKPEMRVRNVKTGKTRWVSVFYLRD